MSRCYIELTIVDISSEVLDDSNHHNGAEIKRLVGREDLPIIRNSQATSFASNVAAPNKQTFTVNNVWCGTKNDMAAVWNDSNLLQDLVLCFVKLSDQYLALSSLLLKSKAFYLSMGCCCCCPVIQGHSFVLPIVELPRTEFGKPYVPPPITRTNTNLQSYYPLSISHQFPFAGMARLVATSNGSQDQSELHSQIPVSPLVGLDIVVFEQLNHQLYESTMEFVSVFQDSFTEWEWQNCILTFATYNGTNDDDILLREFYLRWSIKEAYTKAVGLGMSLEFASFETRLQDFECCSTTSRCHEGLWSRLASCPSDFLHFVGSVTSDRTNYQELYGNWDFFFKPLYKHDHDDDGSREVSDHTPIACACICVGPSHTIITNVPVSTRIQTVNASLQDLLSWHNIRDTGNQWK